MGAPAPVARQEGEADVGSVEGGALEQTTDSERCVVLSALDEIEAEPVAGVAGPGALEDVAASGLEPGLAVEGRPIFTCLVLYVSVTLGELTPMATPPEVMEAFGPATDRPE